MGSTVNGEWQAHDVVKEVLSIWCIAGMAWLDAPTPFMRMRTPLFSGGSVPRWQRPITSAGSGQESAKDTRVRPGGARVIAPQNLFKGVPCEMF